MVDEASDSQRKPLRLQTFPTTILSTADDFSRDENTRNT